MDLIKDSKTRYINYKGLIFWIKSCYYKLYFSEQLYFLSDGKIFDGSIQTSPKLLVVEIDFNIAQGEERHFKNNTNPNVSQ